ncbi:MAG TPA: FimV/HubP family polar landmark protein [Burkholderiales bacterium]|nr:FimV/HubP family polar landmark protein [Burkholderiales bacterium]
MRDYVFKRWIVAAAVALLAPGAADAAGLGRLTVLSALGQPLTAEIDLVSPQKGESITARVALPDLYQQAGLVYNPALPGTRITLETRPNGQPYLKASSPRAVNEPFLELLVELNSEHGRVTRQYTILLDPPGYGRAAAEIPPPVVSAPAPRPPVAAAPPAPSREDTAAATPAAPVAAVPAAPLAPAPAAPAKAGAPRAAASAAAPPAARAPAPAEPSAQKEYGPVKRGETLGRIARTVRPEGTTLEQTLVGLYRQNPDAFMNKNMNLVKSGRILRVPEANELTAVPQREAVKEVKLQVGDFNAYRARLAGRAGDAPEATSVTSGRIGTRVAEPGASEPRDTVRLSRTEASGPQAGAKGKPSTADRVRTLEEEVIAREKALAEANERIARLEKTIKDMQRLVELNSGGMAAAQKAAEKSAKGQPAPDAKGQPPGVVAVAPPPAKAADTAPAKGAPPPAKAPDASAKAAPDAAKGTAADSAKGPADKAKTVTADAGKAAAQAPGPKPAAPPPAPEPDLLDTVMGEPLYLAAGSAVLLLGGLAFVMARRRRSADEPFKDESGKNRITPSLGGSPPPPTPPTGTAPTRATSARAAGPGTAAAATAGAAAAATAGVAAAAGTDDNDLDFGAAVRNAGANPAQPPARAPSEPAATPPIQAAPRSEPGTPEPAPIAERAPPAAGKPAEPAIPQAPTVHEPVMLDVPPVTEPLIPEPPKVAAPVTPEKTPESPLPDFSLDTIVPPPSEPTPAKSPEPSLSDFSLDTIVPPPPSEPEPAPAKPTASSNLIDFDLDPLPSLDVPSGAPASQAAVQAFEPKSMDFKLDDLKLELGDEPAKAAAPPKDDHWYDVQQKFDLAKAYEEMGDKDGARDILREVLKEGDSEQQAQATKLLESFT